MLGFQAFVNFKQLVCWNSLKYECKLLQIKFLVEEHIISLDES